jgi:hypothetical protein
MTDARLGREAALVPLNQDGADVAARLGREAALVPLNQDGADVAARLGRVALLVILSDRTPVGMVHGHRTGLAFNRA